MPPLHVLVVEDDGPVRRACCEVAAGMGCAVVQAENVPAARRILKFQKIDLLLLDLRLPGGGGLTLLEEVKARYPETGVVVMTAFATVARAVEAMRMGAGDYLTKPFAVEDLKTVHRAGGAADAVRCGEPAAAGEAADAIREWGIWWASRRRWRSCTGFCRRWRSRRIRC